MERQSGDVGGGDRGDGHLAQPGSNCRLIDGIRGKRKVIPGDLGFDRNLPDSDCAECHVGAGRLNASPHGASALRVGSAPRSGCAYDAESASRPSNASSNQSGKGSSKLSGMRILPSSSRSRIFVEADLNGTEPRDRLASAGDNYFLASFRLTDELREIRLCGVDADSGHAEAPDRTRLSPSGVGFNNSPPPTPTSRALQLDPHPFRPLDEDLPEPGDGHHAGAIGVALGVEFRDLGVIVERAERDVVDPARPADARLRSPTGGSPPRRRNRASNHGNRTAAAVPRGRRARRSGSRASPPGRGP